MSNKSNTDFHFIKVKVTSITMVKQLHVAIYTNLNDKSSKFIDKNQKIHLKNKKWLREN